MTAPDDERADIDALAKFAYATGQDPLDYAEKHVALLLGVHATVLLSRAENPASFPGFSRDLSREALARRIIGALMDAGWTPPEVPS